MNDEVFEYLDLDREAVENLGDWDINLRDHMSETEGSGISAKRKAMKSAIAEAFQAHEAPIGSHIVPKPETSGGSWKRSGRIKAIRLSLKEARGYGERSHRAIRSATVSAEKLRNKVLELADEEKAMVKYAEAKKRREDKRKERREGVKAELKAKAEELDLRDPDRAFYGSVREYSFGPDENIRLKAKAESKGIKLELEGLTGDELEAIVNLLS